MTSLRARGGFEVTIQWRDGKLVRADIKNIAANGSVDVVYAGKTTHLKLEKGKTQLLDAHLSTIG